MAQLLDDGHDKSKTAGAPPSTSTRCDLLLFGSDLSLLCLIYSFPWIVNRFHGFLSFLIDFVGVVRRGLRRRPSPTPAPLPLPPRSRTSDRGAAAAGSRAPPSTSSFLPRRAPPPSSLLAARPPVPACSRASPSRGTRSGRRRASPWGSSSARCSRRRFIQRREARRRPSGSSSPRCSRHRPSPAPSAATAANNRTFSIDPWLIDRTEDHW